MNDEATPENLRDTAAAFVVGALTDLEEQAFRRQLMRDPALATYVQSLEPVADALLVAVPAAEPPDSLKGSIMEIARRDAAAAEVVASPRGTSRVKRRSAGGGRLGNWLAKPAIGFATFALIAGAFAIGRSSVDQATPVFKPDSAALRGTGDRDAGGRVEMIGDGSRGAIVKIRGLDPDIGDDVYELWIARGDQILPSSLFAVDKSGAATTVIPEDMAGVDQVMITREPAGGSSQPTRQPLAAAKLN